MATARRNKRTGAWEVRCYAGIDRATGKKRNLSRTLPPDASGDEVAAAKASTGSRRSAAAAEFRGRWAGCCATTSKGFPLWG